MKLLLIVTANQEKNHVFKGTAPKRCGIIIKELAIVSMVSLHTQSKIWDWDCEVIKTVAGNAPNFIKNVVEQIYTFQNIN